ncbi:MAG: phenylalanine--tRNA ligase subunit alpha [Candidatus Bathyarchaeia archaeon]
MRPLDPKLMASSLHENERKIMGVLNERKAANFEELSLATDLNRDAVEKACAWAESKGIIEVEKRSRRFFQLSEEGALYAEEGLPEKRLIRMAMEGLTEIEALREAFPLLNIALIWVRRNGWAEVKDGRIELTKEGVEASTEETVDERIIKRLSLSPTGEEELEDLMDRVSLLLRRGLIRSSERVEKVARLTELGITLIPFLEEVEVIAQLTPEHLRTRSWTKAAFQRYDVKLPAPRIYPGKRHFVSQVIDYIRRFWVELGFREMKGPIVELAFWNFDALFQPQDHPARDLADTFYMKTPRSGRLPDPELVRRVKETHENGWTTGSTGWGYSWDPELAGRCCLRTHTTSLSALAISRLREEDLPAKFFSVGRVFRNETIDWNHLIEFYQTDGIVIGDGVTFRHMLGYLKEYLERMGVERFRFRPGYFPYTEMSLEAEVWVEEKQSWMELFGAGMFRPEVVKPLFGREVPVLAWGPGFDRIVMRHYGINDLRRLYSNDLGQLREAKIWLR